MISSTKPSRPTKADIWRTRSTDSTSDLAARSRNSGVFISEVKFFGAAELFKRNSEQLKNPFEVVVVEETHLDCPFSLSIAKQNFRAQLLLQLLLQSNQMRVWNVSSAGFAVRSCPRGWSGALLAGQ